MLGARVGKAAVMTSSGIILAIVIALIVAYAIARTRRRMGLMVSGKTWIAVIAGVVIVLLALWATQTR